MVSMVGEEKTEREKALRKGENCIAKNKQTIDFMKLRIFALVSESASIKEKRHELSRNAS
jgi:hypothetical protein